MSAEYPDLYNDPTDDPREYAAATIEKFDSSKDLMLLMRVPKAALYSDDKGTVCQERHRSIPLCPTSPPPPSEVIMLAWPPLRRDSPAGWACHFSVKGVWSNHPRSEEGL